MRRLLPPLAAALTLAIAGTASAAGEKIRANPFSFDPGKTGIIVSQWKPKVGLADAGASNHGLVLQKNGDTSVVAAAGASILGAEGQPADGVYEYDISGYCGAGSPRFNLEATDGFHFIGGCSNGTSSPRPEPGWKHVTVDATNPAQAFPPAAAGATIVSLALISDEQGQSIVDNIDVNDNVIEKPGNSR